MGYLEMAFRKGIDLLGILMCVFFDAKGHISMHV